MSFPMGVLCLFIGGVLVWVGSHGTNATSPWAMFQQIIAGFNGTPANATRPADPWDAVGAAVADAGAAGASDASGASGSSLSHRAGSSSGGGANRDDAIDSAIRNFRANSADTTAADNAAAVAAQQRLRHIQNDLDQTGPLAWP